nr:hypothetical protein [Maliibacterium massiliense]
MAKKKVTVVEANAENSELISRTEGFSQRFNIVMPQNEKTHFKNRCISAIGEFVGDDSAILNRISSEAFNLMGVVYTPDDSMSLFSFNNDVFSRTKLYGLLTQDDLNIKDDETLFRWLMMMEHILNSDTIKDNRRKALAFKIAESLKASSINAVLCDTADGYLFYPANAELLDQKLVVDILNWLGSYPAAKEQYNVALRACLKGDRTRSVIDSLRLSVELFLRQVFNNHSSLENQQREVGKYLKQKNITVEVCNMYVKLLNYFTTYNNQHIKHNDHSDVISAAEIEYLVYTTGSFLRFIIQLENDKSIVE